MLAGNILTKKKLHQIESDLASGKEVSGLIASMVSGGDLSEEEVTSNILDLLGAALDTVSIKLRKHKE